MAANGQAGGQPGQQSNTPWQRFRGMPRLVQVLIAVGVALTLMICTCCGSIGVIGALGGGSPSALSTATTNSRSGANSGSLTRQSKATTGPTQAVATVTPTAQPTATARPQPTATTKPIPQPTATPKPIPQPTATPKPCASPCNPWGYNFTCCNKIYSPPSNFCYYFNCIPSFWKYTNGYVMECKDGMYSHSGGVSGSCSYHGGNWRALLAP